MRRISALYPHGGFDLRADKAPPDPHESIGRLRDEETLRAAAIAPRQLEFAQLFATAPAVAVAESTILTRGPNTRSNIPRSSG